MRNPRNVCHRGRHAARDAGLAVGAHRDHTVARRVPQQELSGMHAVVSHPPAHPSAHRVHRAACRAGCSAVGKACQHPLDLRFSREHPPSLLILLSQYGTGGCSGAWFLGRQVQTAVPFAIEPPEPQLGFLCATPTHDAPLPSNLQTHPWRTAHTCAAHSEPVGCQCLVRCPYGPRADGASRVHLVGHTRVLTVWSRVQVVLSTHSMVARAGGAEYSQYGRACRWC